jgi:hypothetical protein
MGYYIRVLGTRLDDIPLKLVQSAAEPARIQLERGTADRWQEVLLRHSSGAEIALIERNPVIGGELGAEELQEFIDEAEQLRPQSAAQWLTSYLPNVKVIYAFQLLSGTDVDDGWTILHRVYETIWKVSGGLLQADSEGFSNEEGFTIVWQFSDGVKGAWNMAVLDGNGKWLPFEMELANRQHRAAFMRGEVPVGAKRL